MNKIELILKEREELSKKREENLERIQELDIIIDEYKKKVRYNLINIFLNNRKINDYLLQHHSDETTTKFSLSKSLSFNYKKLKIYFLERKSLNHGSRMTYYQKELDYYKKEKKDLENENIIIHNKIFVIDHELKKEFVDIDDKMEVNDDRHKINKRK